MSPPSLHTHFPHALLSPQARRELSTVSAERDRLRSQLNNSISELGAEKSHASLKLRETERLCDLYKASAETETARASEMAQQLSAAAAAAAAVQALQGDILHTARTSPICHTP